MRDREFGGANPNPDRAVVYYGSTPTDDDELRTDRAGVLGHYAELKEES